MKTTRLEVVRSGEKSIITTDRLRVDATVEFYVRVDPSDSGVATAAQALAGKTFRSDDLAETLEGKLVDAILSIAANYTMDELQNNRGRYVDQVQEILKANLAQNGLILESVSLTRLDQTPFHTLDENNAFNAIGLRRLAEIVSNSKKERAVIEADAEVAVRKSKLDATKERLNIDQEEEQAQKRAKADALYKRRNFSPDDVAEAILKAVLHNPALSLVGAEAWSTRLLSRFAPALSRRVARIDLTP